MQGSSVKQLNLLQWKLLRWMATPYTGDSTPVCVIKPGRLTVYPGDLNAEALRALLALRDRGWLTDPDEFGNRRLNLAGKEAAEQLPRPEWTPPKPRPLKDADYEVLACLDRSYWMTPMDCGGFSRSPHSAILTVLTKHGLAECRKGDKAVSGIAFTPEPILGRRAKGSRRFRLTEAGEQVLVDRMATKKALKGSPLQDRNATGVDAR